MRRRVSSHDSIKDRAERLYNIDFVITKNINKLVIMIFHAIVARPNHWRAFTLLETTLVVAVLLGLVGILFVGVNSYKAGADRAICIQQVAKVQEAMRSYCHLNELESGQKIDDLKQRLIGESKFFAAAPYCRSGGNYSFYEGAVPPVGTLFMQCSIVDHTPKDIVGW